MITAGIIGGNGNMGKWMKKLLEKHNFKVLVSDTRTRLSNKELAEKSDIIIFSVPIGKTVEIIKQVLPYTRQDQMLMDLTSIKTPAVNAMKGSPCEILSIHPMFSHTIESLKGQRVIFCKITEKDYTKKIKDLFIKEGVLITESTPDKHDKIMATIQGLTHFNTIVTAHALMKLGVDIDESMKYTSPIYKIRMDMIGRILAQDPKLYAEIETLNPYTLRSVEQLRNSAHELIRHIEIGDVEGFIEFFNKSSKYLGDFTKKAMDESNYLIKKMAEKEKR